MTFPAVSMREFTITDYAAALSLWGQVEGVEVSEGDLEDEIEKFLARNSGLSRVAEANGQVVGAALCGHDGRRGWIYHLAVLPQYHGKGLGAALVNECVKGLGDAGIKRAIILVAADNPRGRKFWHQLGWEEIDGAVPMARDV